MRQLTTLLTLCGLAALPALAQPRFTGFVGGGFTEPINPIGKRLDRGWNAAAGAGISNDNIGLMVDFTFLNNPINRTTLNNLGMPDGSTRVWGITLDPVVHVTQRGPVDFYMTGGGGIYHRTVEFTQPAIATITVFDPWFGFYPADIATNQVIGSYGVYKGGINGGVGASFRIGGGAKVFAEARYHHIFTGRVGSDFIPVTFGIRW
jgi:hypothetical protein